MSEQQEPFQAGNGPPEIQVDGPTFKMTRRKGRAVLLAGPVSVDLGPWEQAAEAMADWLAKLDYGE